MSALHALGTRGTAPDLHVEPLYDRPHDGEILLILCGEVSHMGRATTARARRRDRSRVGFIDSRRNRPTGTTAVRGAGSPPRSSAMSQQSILRKRCGLSEARPSCGVQLVLEALILALQAITFALGLALVLLRTRHLVTQARDLVLLALDQIVTVVAGRSRALVRHARVMPYRRTRYKHEFLDLAPSCAHTR